MKTTRAPPTGGANRGSEQRKWLQAPLIAPPGYSRIVENVEISKERRFLRRFSYEDNAAPPNRGTLQGEWWERGKMSLCKTIVFSSKSLFRAASPGLEPGFAALAPPIGGATRPKLYL